MVDESGEQNALSKLADEWNEKLRAARKDQPISSVLRLARQAIEDLERALGPRSALHPAQIHALRTMRKIAYNSAADAYPAWDLNPKPVAAADLEHAAKLALTCRVLVEELGEDAQHQGNAIWLIGALDLAQGRRAAASAEFNRAITCFNEAQSPLMIALAEGFVGIAAQDLTAFDGALAKIGGLDDQDAAFMIEQLTAGWHAFVERR